MNQLEQAAFDQMRGPYEKWSLGQPFRTDLATWHAFRAGAEWKSQTEPLGFQTRRAIKAEDELRVAQEEIEDLNKLLNAAYVDTSAIAATKAVSNLDIKNDAVMNYVTYPCGCSASEGSPSYCPTHMAAMPLIREYAQFMYMAGYDNKRHDGDYSAEAADFEQRIAAINAKTAS